MILQSILVRGLDQRYRVALLPLPENYLVLRRARALCPERLARFVTLFFGENFFSPC